MFYLLSLLFANPCDRALQMLPQSMRNCVGASCKVDRSEPYLIVGRKDFAYSPHATVGSIVYPVAERKKKPASSLQEERMLTATPGNVPYVRFDRYELGVEVVPLRDVLLRDESTALSPEKLLAGGNQHLSWVRRHHEGLVGSDQAAIDASNRAAKFEGIVKTPEEFEIELKVSPMWNDGQAWVSVDLEAVLGAAFARAELSAWAAELAAEAPLSRVVHVKIEGGDQGAPFLRRGQTQLYWRSQSEVGTVQTLVLVVRR